MSDRKFRNRVQKARELRETIRQNRFIGMDSDGHIIKDRWSAEKENLAELNRHLNETLAEFGLIDEAVKATKSIQRPEEFIDEIVCTKVQPTEQKPVPDGDGTYAGNWKVVDNTKKVEAQQKEITKIRNKQDKLAKKVAAAYQVVGGVKDTYWDGTRWRLSIEEDLMLSALNGEYLPKN